MDGGKSDVRNLRELSRNGVPMYVVGGAALILFSGLGKVKKIVPHNSLLKKQPVFPIQEISQKTVATCRQGF